MDEEEAPVLAYSISLASGHSSPLLREGIPWPPRERYTAIFADSPLSLMTIDAMAFRRILRQAEGATSTWKQLSIKLKPDIHSVLMNQLDVLPLPLISQVQTSTGVTSL